MSKHLSRSSLRKERFILTYNPERAYSPPFQEEYGGSCRGVGGHTASAEAKNKQEVGIDEKASSHAPTGPLPPAKLCLLKVSQHFKKEPAAGDQVFKHTSVRGTVPS